MCSVPHTRQQRLKCNRLKELPAVRVPLPRPQSIDVEAGSTLFESYSASWLALVSVGESVDEP